MFQMDKISAQKFPWHFAERKKLKNKNANNFNLQQHVCLHHVGAANVPHEMQMEALKKTESEIKSSSDQLQLQFIWVIKRDRDIAAGVGNITAIKMLDEINNLSK